MQFHCNEHTSLRVPAYSRYLLTWDSFNQLQERRRHWQPEHPHVFVLGMGTNVVLTKDIEEPCLHSLARAIHVLHEERTYIDIKVDAGYSWNDLVWHSLNNRWYGLENLVSIPGTVGAAPVQNIGAYGRQFSNVCLDVSTFDWASGDCTHYTKEQCSFDYRTSRFKPLGNAVNSSTIITSVTLRLKKIPDITMSDDLASELQLTQSTAINPSLLAQKIAQLRMDKLPEPKMAPNVGSFFHNPVITRHQYHNRPELMNKKTFPVGSDHVKLSAAELIDARHWKGYQAPSGAAVSRQHALCLTHNGKANGKDILALARAIQNDIHEAYGIMLSIEPAIY